MTTEPLALNRDVLSLPQDRKNILGKGRSTEVLSGTYAGRQVAVKCFLETSEGKAKAKHEADVMARLDSDFHVSIVGHLLEENPPLLVMELLQRGSLRSLLENKKFDDTPLSSRYRLLRDVALGLAMLHSKTILHCDVNSSNVLIDKDGRAKLGDFEGSVLGPVAENNMKRVSAIYGAPEVLKSTLISASDVYSFGVVCWEVASLCPIGELAVSEKFRDFESALQNGQLNIEWPQGFPPPLIKIMYACCAKEPGKRPRATEVAQVLEKLWHDAVKVEQGFNPSEEKENLTGKLISLWKEWTSSSPSPFETLLQKSPHSCWQAPSSPEYTLGNKLQCLRRAVLTVSGQKLSSYIAAEGQSQLGGEQTSQPLYPWVERELLKGNAQVLLLQGHSGAGKSMFGYHLQRTLWQNPAWEEYRPGDPAPMAPIPIFIPLQSEEVHPQNLWDYYLHIPIPKCSSFTQDEIAVLKRDYQLVWIADGFDQVLNRTREDNKSLKQSTPLNLYDVNRLEKYEGRVKLLITHRNQHGLELEEGNFMPHPGGKPNPSLFRMIFVAPDTVQLTQNPQERQPKKTSLGTSEQKDKKVESKENIGTLSATKGLFQVNSQTYAGSSSTQSDTSVPSSTQTTYSS